MIMLDESLLIKIINKLGYKYSYSEIDNMFNAYLSSSDEMNLCFTKKCFKLKDGLLSFMIHILDIKKDDKYCIIKLPKECFGLKEFGFHFDTSFVPKFYNYYDDLFDVTLNEAMMVMQQIDKNGDYLTVEQKEKFKKYIINIDDISVIIAYELTKRYDSVILFSPLRANVAVALEHDYNTIHSISHCLQRDRNDALNINGRDVIEKFLKLNTLPDGREYSMEDLFKYVEFEIIGESDE